jgi:hypothetical protein
MTEQEAKAKIYENRSFYVSILACCDKMFRNSDTRCVEIDVEHDGAVWVTLQDRTEKGKWVYGSSFYLQADELVQLAQSL